MKNAEQIITHILKPFEKNIYKIRCVNQIISSLPKNYNKYIKYATLKNKSLYIYVTHPIIKQQLFYNRNTIISILKMMQKYNKCLNIEINQIYINVKRSYSREKRKIPSYYFKKAKPFKNLAKDKEIKELFNKINKELEEKNN